jgi:hypothetical protein
MDALRDVSDIAYPGAIILDVRSPAATVNDGQLLRLRQQFPNVATVGYGRFDRTSVRSVLAIANLGVDGIVMEGDPGGFATAIARASAQRVTRRVMDRIPELVSSRVGMFFRYCCAHAMTHMSVTAACRQAAVSIPAIRRDVSSQNLPPLAWMLGVARALLTAHLLVESRWSVYDVTVVMRYSSNVMLRRTLKTYYAMPLARLIPGESSEAVLDRIALVMRGGDESPTIERYATLHREQQRLNAASLFPTLAA